MVYEETGKGLTPFAGRLPDSAIKAIERADDDAIVAALTTGRAAEEYFYRVVADDREVLGISTAGAFEIARLLGNIEALSDIRAERDESDYHVVVRVRDAQRNVTVLGAARQSLMKEVKVRDKHGQETADRSGQAGEYTQKPDPNAWTICLNKAQRNGILHLAPAQAIVRIVEGFLAAGKGRRLSAEAGARAPGARESASTSSSREAAEMKACWKQIRSEMEDTGTTTEQIQVWFKKARQLSLSAAEVCSEEPPKGATLEMLKTLSDNLKAYRSQMGL